MSATPESPDSLVFECDLEETPEKVWRALTEPALLEAWLTTETRSVTNGGPASQPAPPEPGTKRSDDRIGGEVPRVGASECEILTSEPHRFLRYRWRDRESAVGDAPGAVVHSVVTVELSPCPAGGTRLRLTHGDFTIVSAAAMVMSARIVSVTGARRRRTPIVSFAAPACLRRAA